MTDDTTSNKQAVYGSSDVARQLDIQESTLRKYCLILQDAGYEFLKNEHGYRAFFDTDLIALRKFLKYKDEADMSLKQAAKSVVAWKQEDDVSGVVTENMSYIARYDDLLKEFEGFKSQQREFNKELIQELKKQQEYIDQRLEQRDEALMVTLNQMQETRKQIATEQEKKKKWWQFWR